MPHKDHSSEVSTPILERITGHAISGRSDSREWPESPLKREVMRTVRDVSHLGYSKLQPELKKEDKNMADAAINEPSHSYPQPEISVGHDTTDATFAKPLEERVVDLEDPKTAGINLRSDFPEKSDSSPLKSPVHQEREPEGTGGSCILEESERLSPSRVQVRPDEEPRTSSHSPILAGLKCLPSPVEQVQPKKRRQNSDQSSPQGEDDLDDAPVRKKAKTGTVLHEAVNEESQDSRQDEVVIVQENQASSTFMKPSIDTGARSNTLDQPIQGSLTPSAGSKHISLTASSDPQPHPANRPHFESSFNSVKSRPQTPVSGQNTISASPNSVEPNSSMRSTRSTARGGPNNSSLTDVGIRIVFASSSTAGDSKSSTKFLSSKGVKKVTSVHDCTVLCVGKELKKTSKVILAVLLGKDIVTDSWVTDSVNGNDLLSIVPYLARDPKTEADWGISLEQAIYRGKKGLKVLHDYTIHFTPSSKKELGKNGFDEVKEIVKCAGAKSVSSTLPKKSPEEAPSTIVVATPDGKEVADLHKLGWRVYVKDIISLSVLRGKLDLESDEFLIKEKEQDIESKKRKR